MIPDCATCIIQPYDGSAKYVNKAVTFVKGTAYCAKHTVEAMQDIEKDKEFELNILAKLLE